MKIALVYFSQIISVMNGKSSLGVGVPTEKIQIAAINQITYHTNETNVVIAGKAKMKGFAFTYEQVVSKTAIPSLIPLKKQHREHNSKPPSAQNT